MAGAGHRLGPRSSGSDGRVVIFCSTMASSSILSIPRRSTAPGTAFGSAKSDLFDAGAGRLAYRSCVLRALQPSSEAAQELKLPDRRLSAAHSPADSPGQPADRHAEGVLPTGARGRGGDERADAGVPAGLSDAGGPDRVDGTPVATVGPRPSAERAPGARALGRPPAATAAGAGSRGAGQGPVDAAPGGTAAAGGGGRRPVPAGDRRFFASMPAAQWVWTFPIGNMASPRPRSGPAGDSPGGITCHLRRRPAPYP